MSPADKRHTTSITSPAHTSNAFLYLKQKIDHNLSIGVKHSLDSKILPFTSKESLLGRASKVRDKKSTSREKRPKN